MTRRLFTALCGLVFFVNFGRVMFAALVEPLQNALGVGPAAIGTVTTLVWLGSAVPRIPVGYLLTRVHRERVVIWTGVLLTAGAAFTAGSTGLLGLRVGAFIIGLASGAFFVAAIPLVGDLASDGTGRAVGLLGTASQLAAVVAPWVVLAIVVAVSWRAAFWGVAVAAASVTAVLFVVVRRREGPVRENPLGERNFGDALADWRIILAGVVFVAVVGVVWQGLFNFYVSYLTAAKGIPLSTANSLLTVVFAAGVPAFWLSGRLADRFPHVPYVLVIHAAFLAGLAGLVLAQSLVAIAALTVVVGYTIHSLFPAVDTYMLETLPPANRASAYAIFSGTALLIEATGSGIVGGLTGAGIPFDVVFGIAAVGIGVALLAIGGAHALGLVPTAGDGHVTGV